MRIDPNSGYSLLRIGDTYDSETLEFQSDSYSTADCSLRVNDIGSKAGNSNGLIVLLAPASSDKQSSIFCSFTVEEVKDYYHHLVEMSTEATVKPRDTMVPH